MNDDGKRHDNATVRRAVAYIVEYQAHDKPKKGQGHQTGVVVGNVAPVVIRSACNGRKRDEHSDRHKDGNVRVNTMRNLCHVGRACDEMKSGSASAMPAVVLMASRSVSIALKEVTHQAYIPLHNATYMQAC